MFKILFFIFSFVFFVENSFAVIVDLGLPEDLFSISSEWQIKDNLLQAGDTKLIDINNIATIFTSPNFEVNFFKNIEYKNKNFYILAVLPLDKWLVCYKGIIKPIYKTDDDLNIKKIIKEAYKEIKNYSHYVKSGHNPIDGIKKYIFKNEDFDQIFKNTFVSVAGKVLYNKIKEADLPEKQHEAVYEYLVNIKHMDKLNFLELSICSMVLKNKKYVETIYLDQLNEQNNLHYLWPIPLTLKKLGSLIVKDKDINDYKKIKKILKYVAQINLDYTNELSPTWTLFNQKGSCSSSAYLMAAINSVFGIKTRILSINDYKNAGHNVCECKINDDWAFFDPSYASYFLKGTHLLSFEEIRRGDTNNKLVLHATLAPEKVAHALMMNEGLFFYTDMFIKARSIIIQNTKEYCDYFVDIPLIKSKIIRYDLANQGALGLGNSKFGNRIQIIKVLDCEIGKIYTLKIKFNSYCFENINLNFSAAAFCEDESNDILFGNDYTFAPVCDDLNKIWVIKFKAKKKDTFMKLKPLFTPDKHSTLFMFSEYYQVDD